MIDELHINEEMLTIAQLNQQLKGKYVSVTYENHRYCFRMLSIRSIKTSTYKTSKTNSLRLDTINNELLPVFDMRQLDKPYHTDQSCLLIVADVVGSGLILHVGLVVNSLIELLEATLQEMNIAALVDTTVTIGKTSWLNKTNL